jgi:hypothetical protein
MAIHNIYRIYAQLKDYEPKVWRRFEINGEKTMAELGYAIMLMFEMRASHLFCFHENSRENMQAVMQPLRDIKESDRFIDIFREVLLSVANIKVEHTHYELAGEDGVLTERVDDYSVEADKTNLNSVSQIVGWKWTFEYDFGDSWEIELTTEACEEKNAPLTGFPRGLKARAMALSRM